MNDIDEAAHDRLDDTERELEKLRREHAELKAWVKRLQNEVNRLSDPHRHYN